MDNNFGKDFKITSFGESHGRCVGIVVDGCPAGLKLEEKEIQEDLDKRKPGQSEISTQRKEEDKVEILSGILNGFTTGAPICFLVWNKDVKSESYEEIKKGLVRPGHVDFTAFVKYGGFNDGRGGGRFSGRITAGFVMAGAVAKKLLNLLKIEILAHTIEIGGIRAEKKSISEIRKNVYPVRKGGLSNGVCKNEVRCADLKMAEKMVEEIEKMRKEGDSIGGIIEGIALNLPVGLGEPIFGTLDGEISKALFAIPGVKGVEFGSGFGSARIKGSQNNDLFIIKNGKILTETNNSGGILGGISNGMPLLVRVAIKPTSSISKPQITVNIKKMKMEELRIEGRHDPCIVPRAVPVVEAMLAITICDFALRAQLIPRVIK
ncbi:chorismate synthase [Patescibacteria group bacterium]|nr:chorismate synthase [Patescibacteria group bacterium]MBU4481813.1 chorismate synthase [Patescibacteria group bacterium]